jgi:hypothetical protein
MRDGSEGLMQACAVSKLKKKKIPNDCAQVVDGQAPHKESFSLSNRVRICE